MTCCGGEFAKIANCEDIWKVRVLIVGELLCSEKYVFIRFAAVRNFFGEALFFSKMLFGEALFFSKMSVFIHIAAFLFTFTKKNSHCCLFIYVHERKSALAKENVAYAKNA